MSDKFNTTIILRNEISFRCCELFAPARDLIMPALLPVKSPAEMWKLVEDQLNFQIKVRDGQMSVLYSVTRLYGLLKQVHIIEKAACISLFIPLLAAELHGQTFTDIGTPLIGVSNGSVAWGDYDNDGDLDILLTGDTGSVRVSKIYRNDDTTFVEDTTATLTGVSSGKAVWGDYDNDGDLDILLTGVVGSQGGISKVYRNDNGVFVDINAGLMNVEEGSVAWGDYDNDGDLDILLTGRYFITFGSYGRAAKLYRNDGGRFVDIPTLFQGVTEGSTAWGDYDNDGDLDILLTGETGNASPGVDPESKVYQNYRGSFVDSGSQLTGVYRGSAAWGDYDSDGDLDVLLTGSAGTGLCGSCPVSRIFLNDRGTFVFDVPASNSLAQSIYGVAVWGDYDNDGDLDILLTGAGSKVYRNDNGIFQDISAPLVDVGSSSAAWGDYDNDGDLDILLTGVDGNSQRLSKIYRNNIVTPNTVPSAPTNLVSTVTGFTTTFNWNKATDNQTDQKTLHYNLRLGTSPNDVQKVSPMADINTGYRRVVELGNTNHNNRWTVKNLPSGTYYWSVQTLDHGFAGSAFSTEQSFVIPPDGTPPAAPQLFPLTASELEGEAILNWRPDTEIDLASYRIYRNTTSPAITVIDTVAPGITTYTDRNLSNGTTYYYRITAVDFAGNEGSHSNEVSGTLPLGAFAEIARISAIFDKVGSGSIAWGDYDDDGDLDILLTGRYPGLFSTEISSIYRSAGNTFTKMPFQLAGVNSSAVAWGDYDNDGDLDILLTGASGSTPISKVYRNEPGKFTDINATLPGVYNGSVAWGDYDNDGDLDILLTGYAGSSNYISKVFRNDSLRFVDVNASLTGVYNSAVAWGDYDNDRDLDIIVTGFANSGKVAKIYRNDDGNFVDIAAALPPVEYSSVAWGDYDNDGDLDILLAGRSNAGTISKIYRNDNSRFVDAAINLLGIEQGSAAWGDYDNDGNLDILLSGVVASGNNVTKVYRNDGSGFTDIQALLPTNAGEIAWGDFDNDGDLDILWQGGIVATTKLYRNNASLSNTVPSSPTDLTSTIFGNSVTLNWEKATDGQTPRNALTYNLRVGTQSEEMQIISPMANPTNGARKVPQLGNANLQNSWTIKNLPPGTYYWSVQALDNAFAGSAFATEQSFTIVADTTLFTDISAPLTGVANGTVAWGDYDNDGDLDILLTGYTSLANNISKVYHNEAGNFVDINANLIGASSGSAWGDYDNDGDLDILLTGIGAPRLYRNDGGNFAVDTRANLGAVTASAAAWGDYDNDGDLDLALTGYTGTPPIVDILSAIYRNVKGSFVYDFETNLEGVYGGSIAWGDYDNDRDSDLLLTGNISIFSSISFSSLYQNQSGILLADSTNDLIDVSNSSVAWGDYDNDDELDILLTGGHFAGGTNFSRQVKVYENNRGHFDDRFFPDLQGVTQSAAAWGDYDNDGDLDILLIGNEAPGPVAKLYRNTGTGFTAVSAGLVGVRDGAVAWGDYDNDGDLDILLAGIDAQSNIIAKIYRNEATEPNTPPTPPTNLASAVSGNTVTLSWDKSTDSEPDSNGLTYNLRIGTTPGGVQIVSPMANVSNGYRKVSQLGNTNHNNSWTIRNLLPGTYYWSVQAIDNAFAGSAFAQEASFTIPDTGVVLVISDTSAAAGDTLTIPLRITDATGVAGAEIAIRYNPGILTALGAQTTALTQGFTLADSISSGKIAIVLAKSTGIDSGSGSFINIIFKVNPTALPGDTTTLAFSKLMLYDDTTTPIPATGRNGIFTVSGLASILIAPDSAIVELDSTQIFVAKGRDAGGQPVTINPIWSVIGGIGTVNPSVGDTTNFTARMLGEGYVTARQGALTDSTYVTIGLRGDINRDRIVDVRDAIICLRMIVGLPLPTPPSNHTIPTSYELWSADCDRNRTINSNDAYCILLKSLGRLLPKTSGVASGDKAVVRTSSINVSQGEIKGIAVWVEERTDIFAADFVLRYNSSALAVLAIKPADSTSLFAYNTQEMGKIRLAMINSAGLVGPKGELVKIEFRPEASSNGEIGFSVEDINLFDAQGDPIQTRVLTGKDELISLPQSHQLFQNYPNPFNPETTIRFQLPEESQVRLTVYNLHGQLIRTLVDSKLKAGDWAETWDGKDELENEVPSGIYFCKLLVNGGEWTSIKKMILIR